MCCDHPVQSFPPAPSRGRISPAGLLRMGLPRAGWLMLALCVLQLVAAHAVHARLIDLDPDFFGEREFGVSEQGTFEGVILNVSQHVLAGVQVDITALDKDGAQLWQRTIALPPLKPTQRAPISEFVGLEGGQPASYDTMYRIDDTIGKNPYVTTSTERREVGFSVKGTGDFRTSPVTIASGEKTFNIEYLGQDMVVVLLQNAAGTLELPLFELQGPGNATTRIVLDAKDAYVFHVDGDGAWTIQLRDDPRAQGGLPQKSEFTTPSPLPPSGPAPESSPAPGPPPAPRARQQQFIVE